MQKIFWRSLEHTPDCSEEGGERLVVEDDDH